MKRTFMVVMLLSLALNATIVQAQVDCGALLKDREKKRSLVSENNFLQRLSSCESIDSKEFATSANQFCSDKTGTKKINTSLSAVIKAIPIKGELNKEDYVKHAYCDKSDNFKTTDFKRDFCDFESTVVTQNNMSFDVDNKLTADQISGFLSCIGTNKLRCTVQRDNDDLYIYLRWSGDNNASKYRVRVGSTEVEKGDILKRGDKTVTFRYPYSRGTKVIVDTEYMDTTESCIMEVQPKPCEKPIYKEGNGPICGTIYSESSGPPCGAATYSQGTGAVCGTMNKLGRDASICGKEEQRLEVMKGGCAACGGAGERIPGYLGSTKCEEWKEAGQKACRMWYLQAKECTSPSFGVAQYNTCRHPSFGPDTYKTCRHPSFGTESVKTCRDPIFGLERCEDKTTDKI